MSTALLSVRALRIDFGPAPAAVGGISFDVDRGKVVALVGESGSGKSVTARAALGLLPDTATATGSVTLDGREILGASDSELNRVRGAKVALIFQEPQHALNPVRRIGWQLREAVRAHRKISAAAARAMAIELLTQVEIPDPHRRVDYFPHQLSGGQKQRVAIALALANDPDLLVADEPTTALDVTVQAEILALLDRIRQRTGMGVLLITHNMGVVAQCADRVVVMRGGEIVETGDTYALFDTPEHPYTRALLAAVPRLPEGGDHGSVDGADTESDASPVLEFDQVSVTYPARHGSPAFRAVASVSLTMGHGEVLGLVGESGSGKTTLGRVAVGLEPVTGGRVLFEGHDLTRISARQLRECRRDIAVVQQDPATSLDPRLTIAASIREPLDVHRVGSATERRRRVLELLDAVRLPAALADRLPHQLSGGQRQRVALARALALRPRLLIADEPTSALDVSVQAEVLALFTEIQRDLRFACLFISHDLAVVHQVADRVAVLRSGAVIELGPVHTVFTAPGHPHTRALVDAVPVPDPAVPQHTAAQRTTVTV
ncbi:dipeptide ABC transporter ATP-binding protein [Nocardia vermiculata]|uniref:ABC transporter ATP-binding protein n=1 Tax=Nocardia vermiculata TaxID=257274 RepID=A0A846XX39_9NOCA|nr:ABC transporter ATP-binding protein [Nocardia vermiculata]NKY49648.1 ABC transporter ATP-binding protein [Nocardia vermiculata]